jgi:hypothetical protein
MEKIMRKIIYELHDANEEDFSEGGIEDRKSVKAAVNLAKRLLNKGEYKKIEIVAYEDWDGGELRDDLFDMTIRKDTKTGLFICGGMY